jgi:predicted enzyme related to lactoylglutathione lyase
MTSAMKTIIYPVKDLDRAKNLYGRLLGAEADMDEAYYVQYGAGDVEVGLDPNGHRQGMTGPLAYWHVDDINETLKQLLAAGAEIQQPVRDVGGGRLIATVQDPDGNVIGLLQPT